MRVGFVALVGAAHAAYVTPPVAPTVRAVTASRVQPVMEEPGCLIKVCVHTIIMTSIAAAHNGVLACRR